MNLWAVADRIAIEVEGVLAVLGFRRLDDRTVAVSQLPALRAVILVSTGCGSGISVDPSAFDRPGADAADHDERQDAEGADASWFDHPFDASRDEGVVAESGRPSEPSESGSLDGEDVTDALDGDDAGLDTSVGGASDASIEGTMPCAILGRVRRNQFIGNDSAVFLTVPSLPTSPQQTADFGTADEPGGNVFRCNSALQGTGGDFAIVSHAGTEPPWGGVIHLAGNAWDHAPPTIMADDPSPNGCDISIRAPAVTLDVASSSVTSMNCPVDRVPGR